ncbi:MAG: ECF-type sigma factor [Pseudomonadota bacterium]
MTDAGDLTQLLKRSVDGDEVARDTLWRELHQQIRAMAQQRLNRESAASCQATELVHEAYLKLDSLQLVPRDRFHFLGLVARAMRQVLVDQARARLRDKRGAGLAPVTLMTRDLDDDQTQVVDVLDLERALSELEGLDARKARAVELSYFAGLSDQELSDALEVSTATVKRDLRTARAWLATAMGE